MPTSPSSASNSKLAELRDSLRDLNRQLFNLIEERRSIVGLIQQQKTAVANFAAFDWKRELALFRELESQLRSLSLHELLAFSTLMEGQAGAPAMYPAWSDAVHLLEAPSHKEHRLNPLLLKVLLPEAFATLKLNPQFGFLRSI
jgi:chorismate mutase